MATYNGARFLREQLESISHQTSLPDELVIGDDGSSDETVAIIENFSRDAPFPVYLDENRVNLGYGENFLRVMSRCKSDWIAICDQDDVWLNHKLERVRDVISHGPADLTLVVHQADVVDEGLVRTGEQLPRFPDRTLVPRRGHKCFWLFHGLGLVVKRTVITDFDWKNRPRRRYGHDQNANHDNWICYISNAIGSTLAISEACALYRRHASAITQKQSLQEGLFDWLRGRFNAVNDDFAQLAFDSRAHQDYFLKLSESSPTAYRDLLMEHAEDFHRQATIANNRERIQNHPQFLKRIHAITNNILLRAYGYRAPYKLGMKSFFRDAARALHIV